MIYHSTTLKGLNICIFYLSLAKRASAESKEDNNIKDVSVVSHLGEEGDFKQFSLVKHTGCRGRTTLVEVPALPLAVPALSSFILTFLEFLFPFLYIKDYNEPLLFVGIQ